MCHVLQTNSHIPQNTFVHENEWNSLSLSEIPQNLETLCLDLNDFGNLCISKILESLPTTLKNLRLNVEDYEVHDNDHWHDSHYRGEYLKIFPSVTNLERLSLLRIREDLEFSFENKHL